MRDAAAAARFARTGLDNVAREYPNHPGHLLTGAHDLRPPRALHPVFFGSYDWHSSVHQHWLLVRLLHLVPDLPEADAIHAWFDDRLTNANIEVEVAYLADPSRRTFERPYGWTWLTLLQAALLARVLAPDAYRGWLDRFLPDPTPLTLPALVDDRTDPQAVHLDGLNLSRAWCWLRLAAPLPDGDPRRAMARTAARVHREASQPHVLDDDVGSHWLPSFVLYLDAVEVEVGDSTEVATSDPGG